MPDICRNIQANTVRFVIFTTTENEQTADDISIPISTARETYRPRCDRATKLHRRPFPNSPVLGGVSNAVRASRYVWPLRFFEPEQAGTQREDKCAFDFHENSLQGVGLVDVNLSSGVEQDQLHEDIVATAATERRILSLGGPRAGELKVGL